MYYCTVLMPNRLMTENRHIEILFKNLQDGLKNHSIKELNDVIVIALNSKDDKKSDIDYVLNLVSKEYEISITTLLKNYGRGKIKDAKQMSYCLLHFNLGLSIRYISKKVFSNWPTSIVIGIKRLKMANPKIKDDAEFTNTYSRLESVLQNYLKNKNLSK